jgi:hypothetical protein
MSVATVKPAAPVWVVISDDEDEDEEDEMADLEEYYEDLLEMQEFGMYP